jgi:hypothetical protein
VQCSTIVMDQPLSNHLPKRLVKITRFNANVACANSVDLLLQPGFLHVLPLAEVYKYDDSNDVVQFLDFKRQISRSHLSFKM